MKKLGVAAVLAGLCSCSNCYDPVVLIGERVQVLEGSDLTVLNENLATLRRLVSAVEGNDYITSFTDRGDGSYTLTLASNPQSPVTVHSAADGSDGRDGRSLSVGVREVDGVWYWTFGGELTDLRASAADGKDGLDAQDRDPRSRNVPLVKVGDGGYWTFSNDGGKTWYMVTTPEGNLVYARGQDGQPDRMFLSVTLSEDGSSVTFVLTDGTVITIPVKIN